jgi:hypothetical protein
MSTLRGWTGRFSGRVYDSSQQRNKGLILSRDAHGDLAYVQFYQEDCYLHGYPINSYERLKNDDVLHFDATFYSDSLLDFVDMDE